MDASDRIGLLTLPLDLQDSQIKNPGQSFTARFLSLYQLFRQGQLMISLEHTLSHVRLHDCTDPRDKIFGVLNLIPISEWRSLPDYTKSAISVYKNLNMLRCCEWPMLPMRQSHLRKEFRMQALPRLPSWVPDWTCARQVAPLAGGYELLLVPLGITGRTPYTASKDLSASLKFTENYEVLCATGMVFDTIDTVSGLV